MNNEEKPKVHWSFWAIAAVGLIWNLLGVANYFVQMDPEMLSQYRESERAIVEGRPAWATAGFAMAVFGGAIGCLLLLIRSRVAFYLFVVSLVGVIGTIAHALGLDIDFGGGEIVGIILMPFVVAALLLWYSRIADEKGWLR